MTTKPKENDKTQFKTLVPTNISYLTVLIIIVIIIVVTIIIIIIYFILL